MGFATEQKLMLRPFSAMIRCMVLPDLFAGKIHALLYRKWAHRVKGRDWYDFEWYVRNGVPLNFEHFCQRAKDFNGANPSKDDFLQTLNERLSSTDMEMVRRDVLPFVKNRRELEIWSNDYFVRLAGMMKMQHDK